MNSNDYTSGVMTQKLVNALPKLFRELDENWAISEDGFFLVGTLIALMPDGLLIEKRAEPEVFYKVRYPKLGCGMMIRQDNLPQALGEMILLLARNGYMKRFR